MAGLAGGVAGAAIVIGPEIEPVNSADGTGAIKFGVGVGAISDGSEADWRLGAAGSGAAAGAAAGAAGSAILRGSAGCTWLEVGAGRSAPRSEPNMPATWIAP